MNSDVVKSWQNLAGLGLDSWPPRHHGLPQLKLVSMITKQCWWCLQECRVGCGNWANILWALLSKCQLKKKGLAWRNIRALGKSLIEKFSAQHIKERGTRREWILRRGITLHDQLCLLDDFAKFVWVRAQFRRLTCQFAVCCDQHRWSTSKLRRLRVLNHAAHDILIRFQDGGPSRGLLPIANCTNIRELFTIWHNNIMLYQVHQPWS